MQPVEHTALDVALDTAIRAAAEPTLPQVVEAVLDPRSAVPGATVGELAHDGRHLGHALRRLVAGDLAGLFDGPSTVALDPSLPMVTLDLSRVQGSDQMIAMLMTCASAWMEAALADPHGGQRWVIYDEAWRLMRQPALLARMQSQWKLSRGLGIANLLIVHRLSDLDAVGDQGSEARALARGLLADCSTKIVYQQEVSEAAHAAARLGLTTAEREQLPNLQRGEGLWRVGSHAFVVRHATTAGEAKVFNTDARMRLEGRDRDLAGRLMRTNAKTRADDRTLIDTPPRTNEAASWTCHSALSAFFDDPHLVSFARGSCVVCTGRRADAPLDSHGYT